MPQYDLAGNPLPEKDTDQRAASTPLGGPPPLQRPLYAQGAPPPAQTRYDMAGNALPLPNAPASGRTDLSGNSAPPPVVSATRYDLAGNAIASAPQSVPHYAVPPTVNSTWPPPPSGAGYGRPIFVNTSGSQGDVPPEIARLHWNWGAFLLPRLWCYRHGLSQVATMLWISLFIVRFLSRMLTGSSGIAAVVITFLLDFGVGFYLGLKGHEIAWRNRRFDDLTQYFKVQQAWMIGGIVWQVFVIGFQFWLVYSVATMSHSL